METARVSFEYQSVMITPSWLPGVNFGNCFDISVAKNLSGPGAGNS